MSDLLLICMFLIGDVTIYVLFSLPVAPGDSKSHASAEAQRNVVKAICLSKANLHF
jgi:hypothetical protein